jgi:hypothetical protein
MSGGGKGGSQTQQVKIPAWLEDAAQSNLARADALAQIGYTPYYGPDVAALSPMQVAAMQNTGGAASAFGMAAPVDAMAGMPQAQQFAGGVQGYSSAPMFEQSLAALAAARPGQYAALQSPFIDPFTGAQPGSPFGTGAGAGGMAVSGQQGFSGSRGGSSTQSRGSDRMWSDGMTTSQIAAAQRDGTFGAAPRTSGGGTSSLNTPLSYAPGGVNTRNPASVTNRVAAAVTGPQGAPTAANRPVSRSSNSGGGSSGMGGGK